MIYTYDEAMAASLEYFNGDELAAAVFVDKYALRNENEELVEGTPVDMHVRLALALADIERDKFSKPFSAEEIYDSLRFFNRIIPQGSVMFGVGNHQYVTLSNCYCVQNPEDSYGSIHYTDQCITQISKRRGGVGVDISRLRPAMTPTTNSAGSSTGPVSFSQRFSNSTREVGQSGRRGSLMTTMSVHHPDIISFIEIKLDPSKNTGTNMSIRLTDEFLQAVQDDTEYEQRWPVDSDEPKISNMVNASKIWKRIIKCAWTRAEPGLLFWDRIIDDSLADCYADVGYNTCSTNPCCFAYPENIKVVTNNGLKSLNTITSDDLIWVDTAQEWCKNSGYFEYKNAIVNIVRFDNGDCIYVTTDHKLAKYIETIDGYNYKLQQVKYLSIGDKILCQQTSDHLYVTISEIQKQSELYTVGCIEVEDHHQFTANGIISGNSELPLCVNDSCRLLLLNTFSYVRNPFTNKAYFDYKAFYEDAILAQRYMDNIVDLEIEAIKRIIKKVEKDPEEEKYKVVELDIWNNILEKCVQGRRIGVGANAIGDTLAALNLGYGTKKSVKCVEKIFKTLKFGVVCGSIELAEEVGAFPVWDWEKEKDHPFLLQLKDESINFDGVIINGIDLYNKMAKYGRRNIGLLTCSPSGSVSILTQTTSGIEPLLYFDCERKKKINQNDENTKIDFTDPNTGDKFQIFKVYHPKVKMWMDITGKTDIKESPWYGYCANDVSPMDRIAIQAAAQKHIDHAISSTVNLPKHATQKQVAEVYEEAWRTGIIKGITVYRDGCRSNIISPVGSTMNERPKEVRCDVHHISVSGLKYFVLVGIIDGKPYEIFAGKNGFLPAKIKSGTIVRKRKDYYIAQFDDSDIELSPITASATTMEEGITRLVSTALRHGADMYHLVQQLEKVGEKDELQSFSRGVARALKKYIIDGTVEYGEICPECEQESLVRQQGCPFCTNCGYSKCI